MAQEGGELSGETLDILEVLTLKQIWLVVCACRVSVDVCKLPGPVCNITPSGPTSQGSCPGLGGHEVKRLRTTPS